MQEEPKLVPNTPIKEEEESGKKGLIFNSNVISITLSLPEMCLSVPP